MSRLNLRILAAGLFCLILSAMSGTAQTGLSQTSQVVPPSVPLPRALEALSSQSGKAVCWVGEAPKQGVTVPADARTLADAARSWAGQLGATLICTPDAVFFLAPQAFAHVRPAHFDEQLEVFHVLSLLNELPPSLLARFPLGVTDAPIAPVGPTAREQEMAREALPLTFLEKEHPGFEARIRSLLKQAHALVQIKQPNGGQEDVMLDRAPTERLSLRLQAYVVAVCSTERAGKRYFANNYFPVSSARYAADSPLFVSAEPMRAALAGEAAFSTQLRRGLLGDLISSGQLATDNRRGAKVVIDKRLRELPLTVITSANYDAARLWTVIEKGIGVERRDLGGMLFFGPWLNAEESEQFAFLSRWALSRGEILCPMFTPLSAHELMPLAPRQLDWQQLSTILAELRRKRTAGDEQARSFTEEEWLAGGRLSFTQAISLEVFYVTASDAKQQVAVLGRHRFKLE